MNRMIRNVDGLKDLKNSLELVDTVFAESEGEEKGKEVRSLVEEIRSKQYYLPELDLIMVNEEGTVIGYAMFSRFHLGGKYENQLLLLTPVAVKTALQRQHISKELIEFGFETSCNYGIIAGESVHLPSPECLMVKELQDGALQDIKGTVDYSYYHFLT